MSGGGCGKGKTEQGGREPHGAGLPRSGRILTLTLSATDGGVQCGTFIAHWRVVIRDLICV